MFQRAIRICFILLFLLLPLVLTPVNSELFEFNKVVLLYASTTLITTLWLLRMLKEKTLIYTGTPIQLPLLIFLGAQFLATIFSIDPHTSVFGYYSRFNGGLLTSLCYTLLYFAYVANHTRNQIKTSVISILTSASLVSLYAVAQHFGIDAHLWVQDVKSRVFSTLGQPNWLAAFTAAVIFLPLSLLLQSKPTPKPVKILLWLVAATVFLGLLFTKSRSGLLGFWVADMVFWLSYLRLSNPSGKLKMFFFSHLLFAILIISFGTPWTQNFSLEHLLKSSSQIQLPSPAPAPYLNISESADIRKIVWKGAFRLWQKKPLLGTGLETFAYSYYWVRPIEHNQLSEWDFVYNKAHNQYLNYAATTGTTGIGLYLVLIITTGLALIKNLNTKIKEGPGLAPAVLAGWVSILVTNFFGFSVVPVDTLFYLLPAFSLLPITRNHKKFANPSKLRPVGLAITLILSAYFFFLLGRYWLGDYHFALSNKAYKDPDLLKDSFSHIRTALSLNPVEPAYTDQLSVVSADLALSIKDNATVSGQFKDLSLLASERTVQISPYNLIFLKSRTKVLFSLSEIYPEYLSQAIDTLVQATKLAPTDPKLLYNLGLLKSRADKKSDAIADFKKALDLKPDYQDPLLALGLVYEEQGQYKTAVDYYTKLLSLNPNHQIALTKMELLEKQKIKK